DWTRLLDKSNDFYGEKAFLLFSADISGIQNFIYSIVSKGAMRSLKTRSAWLELLMESFIDEMLDLCGLSRACLIYSGGGHCYILLPNISSVKDTVKKTADAYNAWLMRQYGSDLYIAAGYAEATANDLMNKPESSQDKAPLNELFITLSRTISQKKLHRYSAEDIRFLNSDSGGAERECVNCGRSSVVLDKNSICEQCASFVKTAALLGRPGNLILVTRDKPNCPCLEFPSTGGSVYMSFDLESNIRKFIAEGGKYIRVYSKNKPYIGLKFSRNIFMGEYSYNNGGSLEELADDGKGFRRVSVLRADVDNLGAAFINGFVKDGKTESERHFYNTLSRKAAFSRQMSVFFRCCINNLLEKPEGLTIYKRNSGEERKKAAVVYSGGDDLFIVGAWADVIESAINIRDAFKKYCGGALTLSAGMGIYEVKYPVIKSAVQTGDLESSAKERFEDKDAAALFSDEMIYKWDVLRDEIIGEKLAVLKSLISDNIIDRAIGNSALYNILGLLKDAENDKINLARFAYQLARLAPTKNTNSEKYKSFRTVSGRLYTWAVDAKSRKQLITAIYIYVYLTRKEEHNV
ncbi:MAG: type III-A CRISPR-associated protein Cas10/Csm1, partial [Clostridia bacterium]|nr:type III-A CRISPR-associated protein Cas10/Csm1 [Clostridia bacterium]